MRGVLLVLSADALEQLRARARAAAPAECCGLLIGRDTADGRVVDVLEPVANRARDAYHVPAARFAATERRARVQGRYVCGVYHSHPAGHALPSARDVALGWPGFDYVILDGLGTVRAWRLADDRQGFREIALRTAR